jgi:eukaryotic-like serine/threonine-protein kinase
VNGSPSAIRRARAVFQCALELDGDERQEFVQDACAGDDELMRFVESLLAADLDEGASFTAAPAVRPSRRASDRADGPSCPVPPGYGFVRELGVGGSGEVHLCREDSTGSLVAIKIIDMRGLGQGGVDRVRREWRILSSIQHSALVRLRAAGTLEERYAFLVMEFVDGLDVRSHVETGMLDAGAIVELLLPVAEALSLAHERGVVHRDLKPSNILVDPDGRARLLDFGAARIAIGGAVSIHHHTLTGEMVGTLAYMSPEQAAGRPSEVDGRTDVYQFATVLYELIEARRADACGDDLHDRERQADAALSRHRRRRRWLRALPRDHEGTVEEARVAPARHGVLRRGVAPRARCRRQAVKPRAEATR